MRGLSKRASGVLLAMVTIGGLACIGPRLRLLHPYGQILSADLVESSGLVASLRYPGTLWTHNDDGLPLLFAVNRQGTVLRRFHLEGISNRDWEDIARDETDHLYILDNTSRQDGSAQTLIYAFPEPDPFQDSSVGPIRNVVVTLPTAGYDIETLLVWEQTAYLVTKPWDGSLPVIFAADLSGPQSRARRIGTLPQVLMITGGDISADGDRIVLSSYRALLIFSGGHSPEELFRNPPLVCQMNAGQVEGVAWSDSDLIISNEQGAIFLVSEADWKGRQAPFQQSPQVSVPFSPQGIPTVEMPLSEWKVGRWLRLDGSSHKPRFARVALSRVGLHVGLELPRGIQLAHLEEAPPKDFDDWFVPGRVYIMLNPDGNRPLTFGPRDRCLVIGRRTPATVGVQARRLQPATLVQSVDNDPAWVSAERSGTRLLITVRDLPGDESSGEVGIGRRLGFNLLLIGPSGTMQSWSPLTMRFSWDAPSVWGLLKLPIKGGD